MLLPLVGANILFQVNNLCNFSVGEKSAVPYPGEGLYVLCVCQAHKHEEKKTHLLVSMVTLYVCRMGVIQAFRVQAVYTHTNIYTSGVAVQLVPC